MAEWNVGLTEALASMLLMYERYQADMWLLFFEGDICIGKRPLLAGFPPNSENLLYGFAMSPRPAETWGMKESR